MDNTSTEVVVPTKGEEQALLRSYLEQSKLFALEKIEVVKSKLPERVTTLVEQTVETGFEYTPDVIKQHTTTAIKTLDGLVDMSDDALVSALEKTQELPKKFEELKENLTTEQLLLLASQIRENSMAEVSKYLPSTSITDMDLQKKAQEIVQMVMSQPQALRENHIGQTISTYVGSMYDITSGAVETISAAIGSFLAVPDWEAPERLKNIVALQQLWSATDVLKKVLNMYASNVEDKLSPITPGLKKLIETTSVLELPMELIKILTEATGISEENEAKISREETRALFWALVDISFLMHVLDQTSEGTEGGVANKKGAVVASQDEPEEIEEVDGESKSAMIPDNEAMKGEWAKGFAGMDFH